MNVSQHRSAFIRGTLFATLLGALPGCSWQLGRAPRQGASLTEVLGVSSEPQLRASIEAGITQALQRRGVPAGPELTAELLSSSSSSLGPHHQELQLTLAFQRCGERLRLSSSSVTLLADTPLESSSARSAAFSALAHELALEAVDRMLTGGGAACH